MYQENYNNNILSPSSINHNNKAIHKLKELSRKLQHNYDSPKNITNQILFNNTNHLHKNIVSSF